MACKKKKKNRSVQHGKNDEIERDPNNKMHYTLVKYMRTVHSSIYYK